MFPEHGLFGGGLAQAAVLEDIGAASEHVDNVYCLAVTFSRCCGFIPLHRSGIYANIIRPGGIEVMRARMNAIE